MNGFTEDVQFTTVRLHTREQRVLHTEVVIVPPAMTRAPAVTAHQHAT